MLDKLIIELFNKKCIRFGKFKLKDGSESKIHIDLRNVISYPYILNIIIKEVNKKLSVLECDRIIGIPYGGIVLSSCLCSTYKVPMILVRKEQKQYGLKKHIEGEYKENDKCIIIGDTITNGSSTIEFINKVKRYKLVIKDLIVICDRRIGKYNFEGITIHSLFTIHDIITVLYNNFLINVTVYNNILSDITKISYAKYTANYSNPVLIKILKNVEKKKNNYCFELKYNTFKEIENFIAFYKDYICIIKLYSDLVVDFNKDKLIEYAQKYNFVIIESKLFNYSEDIFLNEYTQHKMYEWCDMIELSDLHSNKIIKIIDQINNNTTKNVSIIYNVVNSQNTLLYILNKNKNIIGLNKSQIDCDILIFDNKDAKNKKANIQILQEHNYIKNNSFVLF